MSWRDRLARSAAASKPDAGSAISKPPKATDTNGANVSETFPAKPDAARAVLPDAGPSSDPPTEAPNRLVISAESAARGNIDPFAGSPRDADSAIKADRTDPAAGCGEIEERGAAITEQDGRIPRAWVEGLARLDSNRPPARIPLRQWRTVIKAIGVFLDRWAAEAIVLGWEPADILGADADRPEVTWLNAGPLWSGNNARVVAVHADRIVVETEGGARQTAYRRPHLRPRVLPWDLAP